MQHRVEAQILHEEQILEAIDQLRRRKARPDADRICNYLLRKFSVDARDTIADLHRLIEAEKVIQVDYKGNTSYRNASKWSRLQLYKNRPEGFVKEKLNSAMVAGAVAELVVEEPDYLDQGVPAYRLIEQLLDGVSNPTSRRMVEDFLGKEVASGNLTRLANGNYSLVATSDVITVEPARESFGENGMRKDVRDLSGAGLYEFDDNEDAMVTDSRSNTPRSSRQASPKSESARKDECFEIIVGAKVPDYPNSDECGKGKSGRENSLFGSRGAKDESRKNDGGASNLKRGSKAERKQRLEVRTDDPMDIEIKFEDFGRDSKEDREKRDERERTEDKEEEEGEDADEKEEKEQGEEKERSEEEERTDEKERNDEKVRNDENERNDEKERKDEASQRFSEERDYDDAGRSSTDPSPTPSSANVGGFRSARRKTAKKVFDPSDNNLVKRKRGRQSAIQTKPSISQESQDSVKSVTKDGPNRQCSLCAKEKQERLVACRDCTVRAHPSCIYSPEELLQKLGTSWQCERCKSCAVCCETTESGPLATCFTCDEAFHYSCHTPRILVHKTHVKWQCSNCVQKHFKPNIPQSANSIPSRPETPSNTSVLPPVLSPQVSPARGSSDQMEDDPPRDGIDPNIPDASDWTSEQVYQYFARLFPKEAEVFRQQDIDGHSLLLLKRSDVLSGLDLLLGPALKIYRHVLKLQVRRDDPRLYWL